MCSRPQKVPEQLIQDLTSPSIPLPTCTSLHRDLARRAEDAPQEPSSKRAKLDPSLASSSLPLHSRVAVCNAVRATLEAQPVQPPFWTLSLSPSVDPSLYQFLFHVSSTHTTVYTYITFFFAWELRTFFPDSHATTARCDDAQFAISRMHTDTPFRQASSDAMNGDCPNNTSMYIRTV